MTFFFFRATASEDVFSISGYIAALFTARWQIVGHFNEVPAPFAERIAELNAQSCAVSCIIRYNLPVTFPNGAI